MLGEKVDVLGKAESSQWVELQDFVCGKGEPQNWNDWGASGQESATHFVLSHVFT